MSQCRMASIREKKYIYRAAYAEKRQPIRNRCCDQLSLVELGACRHFPTVGDAAVPRNLFCLGDCLALLIREDVPVSAAIMAI